MALGLPPFLVPGRGWGEGGCGGAGGGGEAGGGPMCWSGCAPTAPFWGKGKGGKGGGKGKEGQRPSSPLHLPLAPFSRMMVLWDPLGRFWSKGIQISFTYIVAGRYILRVREVRNW